MGKYVVYNSHTAKTKTVISKNKNSAIQIGRRKGLDTKKGILRAYRVKAK